MKARLAVAVAGVVVVLGVVGALIAQANVAAHDARYAPSAVLSPDEIYAGVAYSVQPWPSVFAAGVIAAVVSTLLEKWTSSALVVSIRAKLVHFSKSVDTSSELRPY